MPVSALKAVSTGQNGVGAFVLQCRKINFHYCDWAGSSIGMNGFIKSKLRTFAAENPEIEIEVSPRPGKHPVLIGYYMNGKERSICVRNLQPDQILRKAEMLRDASGAKNIRTNKPVTSITESVRGVWSPYHGNGNPV